HTPVPIDAARRALGSRRSPSTSEFLVRTSARDRLSPRGEIDRVARASGQAWVRGASAVRSWSVPTTAPAPLIGTALWNAHLTAAGLCYRAALDGGCGARPVSGFSSTGGRWILHAIAFLDSPGGSR
ncbi:hypothetical protein, partial [Microbacterium sp. H6]